MQLQLEDTTADVGSWASNPVGCYFKLSTESLYFNEGGNPDSTSVERVSICIVSQGTVLQISRLSQINTFIRKATHEIVLTRCC